MFMIQNTGSFSVQMCKKGQIWAESGALACHAQGLGSIPTTTSKDSSMYLDFSKRKASVGQPVEYLSK